MDRVYNFKNPKRTNFNKFDTKKQDALEDKRLSICTDCRKGIFAGHGWDWTARGMVHKNCENPKLEGSANETKNAT